MSSVHAFRSRTVRAATGRIVDTERPPRIPLSSPAPTPARGQVARESCSCSTAAYRIVDRRFDRLLRARPRDIASSGVHVNEGDQHCSRRRSFDLPESTCSRAFAIITAAALSHRMSYRSRLDHRRYHSPDVNAEDGDNGNVDGSSSLVERSNRDCERLRLRLAAPARGTPHHTTVTRATAFITRFVRHCLRFGIGRQQSNNVTTVPRSQIPWYDRAITARCTRHVLDNPLTDHWFADKAIVVRKRVMAPAVVNCSAMVLHCGQPMV